MTNPLLQPWNTPFEIAPFQDISDSDFAPACASALAEDMAETLAVAHGSDAPSFANTVEALACTGKALEKVLSVFYTVSGADSNATRENLMRDFSPKLAAHSSAIYSNKELFARIDTLWQNRENLELTAE